MKAKTYLEQIKIMDAKIDTDMEELGRLNALAQKTTSVMGGERVQSSGSQEKMADCVVRIVEMKNRIAAEVDSFIDYKEKVKALLFKHCDADCFKLLYSKYFLYKSWEQIAVEMNFTYHWVAGGLHQRALSQVQKALDERGKDGTRVF